MAGASSWRMTQASEKGDRCRTRRPRCGAICHLQARTIPHASSPTTQRNNGRVEWRRTFSDGQASCSYRRAPRRQGQDHRRAAGGDRGVRDFTRRSTPQPGKVDWRNYVSLAPASPAARPGRTRTTPGRPAAAPSWVTGTYGLAATSASGGTGQSCDVRWPPIGPATTLHQTA